MPLGPSVVLTMSAIAIAPTNDAMRAFSPCTSKHTHTLSASHYHSCYLSIAAREESARALVHSYLLHLGLWIQNGLRAQVHSKNGQSTRTARSPSTHHYRCKCARRHCCTHRRTCCIVTRRFLFSRYLSEDMLARVVLRGAPTIRTTDLWVGCRGLLQAFQGVQLYAFCF